MPPYPLRCSPSVPDTSRTTFRRCSSICSFLNSLHCSRPQGFDVLQEIRLISHPSSTTGFPELESYEKTCSLRSLMVLLIGYKNITTFTNSRKISGKFPKNSWNKVFKPMLMEDSLPVSSSNVPTFLWRRWAPPNSPSEMKSPELPRVVHSRELAYPTHGKGNSSSQLPMRRIVR